MVSAADYGDRKALVVVFAVNSCQYCQAYQNRLVALQNEYGSKGVQLIVISSNDVKRQPLDSYEAMQKRAAEKQYPFPYLYDETQGVAKDYGATRTPEVFVFDASRKLVYHGRIDDNTEEKDVRKQDLKSALDHLLAGTPEKISPAETKAFGCTIKWKQ
jgi:peroxiredoxin